MSSLHAIPQLNNEVPHLPARGRTRLSSALSADYLSSNPLSFTVLAKKYLIGK